MNGDFYIPKAGAFGSVPLEPNPKGILVGRGSIIRKIRIGGQPVKMGELVAQDEKEQPHCW